MTQAMTSPQPLRERQADLTRTALFEGLSQLLAEGAPDITVQDVADRGGVSHRTVYRHFPSRDALFAAYADWLERRIEMEGGLSIPLNSDEIAQGVRREHEVLDAFGPAVIAMLKAGIAGRRGDAHRTWRTQAIRDALAGETTALEPGMAAAVFWVIRCLASSVTWTFIREEGGIDGHRSGEAVAWAIETLLAALRRGEAPGAPGEDGARPG